MSGTTADKLNYLKNTKELLRQEINYNFPDSNLTTSSTFRQYPSKMSSSELWMDAWVGGSIVYNIIYNGTNSFMTGYREFGTISMPNVTDAYFVYIQADTVIVGGPTITKGAIFNSGTINKVYINNLQRVDISQKDSNPIKAVVNELHLPSLTLAAGKRGTILATYALTEKNVYLPRIQNIGAFALKGDTYHIGTELSTVCNLSATSGISSVNTILVPASLLGSYRSATNWSNYADSIQAEPGT